MCDCVQGRIFDWYVIAIFQNKVLHKFLCPKNQYEEFTDEDKQR